MKFAIFVVLSLIVYAVGLATVSAALVFQTGDPRLVAGAASQQIVAAVFVIGPFAIFLILVRWVFRVKF